MKNQKIGLDIDGVIADFAMAWHLLYPDVSARPNRYDYDENMGKRFNAMKEAGTLNDFFLSIKPLIKPEDLPFEPECYVTARPIDSEVSAKWIAMTGFPQKKVYTVGHSRSKVEIMKEIGINIFIDDYFGNFTELNDGGITTYLYTAPWNLSHDVGEMRINSLNDILLLQQ